MDDVRLLRYSRHILLDEFGIEAQERFLSARALVVGAGGLGSPAALFLAAAGLGHITIADGDEVDLTNLQRQILYRENDIGCLKANVAGTALRALNDDVEVLALSQRLEGEDLVAAVSAADIVLDCSDNFATRHALNRACVAHAKPLVSGAAIRFSGQISVFDLRLSSAPCYYCLFPDAAEPDAENCATMGVFAPLTGIIGAMQAGEALKCVAGAGAPLNGRLLLFDALAARWQEISFERDPACPVCSRRE
jgi:molybdopterin/thiamine biosynthesis adenylyltransferase